MARPKAGPGEGELVGLSALFNPIIKIGKHTITIIQNVGVAVTDDNVAFLAQPAVALKIIPVLGMLSAIGLDDKLQTQANEVSDVTANWCLPAKFRTAQTAISQ